MKLVVGADHAGFPLKEEIRGYLERLGHEVIDVGAYSAEPSDYPDFAEALGRVLMAGRADRGILICGSGVGVNVAANKLPGVRACMCHDTYSAHQGVEHDDMNVLVMGARIIGPASGIRSGGKFSACPFPEAGRSFCAAARTRSKQSKRVICRKQ